MSEDPIGLQGGLNAYVYGGGDPINRRDPSGLESCQGFGGPHGHGTWHDTDGDGVKDDSVSVEVHADCGSEEDQERFIEALTNYLVAAVEGGASWSWGSGGLSTLANFGTGFFDGVSLGAGPGARWVARLFGCGSCVNPDYGSDAYVNGRALGDGAWAIGGLALGALFVYQDAAAFAYGSSWNQGFTRIGWGTHHGPVFRIGIGNTHIDFPRFLWKR